MGEILDKRPLSSVEILNTDRLEDGWQKIEFPQSVLHPRFNPALVTINGDICIFGGAAFTGTKCGCNLPIGGFRKLHFFSTLMNTLTERVVNLNG